jgi:hypothetical protein
MLTRARYATSDLHMRVILLPICILAPEYDFFDLQIGHGVPAKLALPTKHKLLEDFGLDRLVPVPSFENDDPAVCTDFELVLIESSFDCHQDAFA